jgi:hypothetical protein
MSPFFFFASIAVIAFTPVWRALMEFEGHPVPEDDMLFERAIGLLLFCLFALILREWSFGEYRKAIIATVFSAYCYGGLRLSLTGTLPLNHILFFVFLSLTLAVVFLARRYSQENRNAIFRRAHWPHHVAPSGSGRAGSFEGAETHSGRALEASI